MVSHAWDDSFVDLLLTLPRHASKRCCLREVGGSSRRASLACRHGALPVGGGSKRVYQHVSWQDSIAQVLMDPIGLMNQAGKRPGVRTWGH